MSAKDSRFQIKLSGEWKDYDKTGDKILKRAYLAGFPHAKYKLRGQEYDINFEKHSQKNNKTGKTREIRPPFKWSAPATPIVPAGQTMCVKVPPGGAGTTIQVPHPAKEMKGQFIAVNVPATAKPGQAMLVPVPGKDEKPITVPDDAPAPPAAAAGQPAKKTGWSTGAKVAAGGAAVVGIGGVAVAGAVMGEHLVEGDFEGAVDALADFGADIGGAVEGAAGDIADAAPGVGDAIAGAAEDAVEWVGDAAETAGDFIMDLF